MNKLIIGLVAAAAFLAGDYQGVIRTKKALKPSIKKLAEEHVRQDMMMRGKIKAYQLFIVKVAQGTPIKEAGQQLEFDLHFSELILPKL